MTFSTSFDGMAKVITLGIGGLFIFCIYQGIIKHPNDLVGLVAGSFFMITIYLFCWLFHASKYIVSGSHLIIKRPIRNVILNEEEIKSVALIPKSDLAWTWRTFGVGGIFGYFGKFTNSQIGGMTWYATRRDKAVLITTRADEKIVVTPDSPIEFVKELNTLLQN